MNHQAITKAQSRLRVAKKAASDLDTCENFEAFDDVWYTFLTAAKNIYTVLEQGAKGSPQSRQWFAGKQRERRADPLLQYIYQARNDDEHGLDPVVKRIPGRMEIGRQAPGYSSNISGTNLRIVKGDISYDTLVSHDGKPILIEQEPARVLLAKVVTRGVTFDPPTEHLGVPLTDLSPPSVAKLAVAYLDSLVEAAAKLA
jgi:hypothetical protein